MGKVKEYWDLHYELIEEYEPKARLLAINILESVQDSITLEGGLKFFTKDNELSPGADLIIGAVLAHIQHSMSDAITQRCKDLVVLRNNLLKPYDVADPLHLTCTNKE